MKKFKLKRGRVRGVEGDVVGNELERIYTKYSALVPKTIVDESRPKTAPLHPAFDWNDKVAGEHWREHQARQIIKEVQIINEDGESHPAFYNVSVVSEENERGYHPVEVVLDRPDLYAEAVEVLVRKLQEAERQVEILKQLARESKSPDRLMRVNIAIEALRTAGDAVRAIA